MFIIFFLLIAVRPLLLYANSRFTNSRAKGVLDAGLAECSVRPNCFCRNHFYGDNTFDAEKLTETARQHWSTLLEAVARLPRTTVVKAEDNYVHCEARSFYFGFIDDLELFHNEGDSCIYFRSESRVGYSDLGVNERRITKLIQDLNSPTADHTFLPNSQPNCQTLD